MFVRFLLRLPIYIGNLFRLAFCYIVVGAISFFIGQALPRKNFDYRVFPYHPFRWEREGRIYLKLRIQFWKDKVPDMSRYISRMFRKKLTVMRSPEYLEDLIAETCVAELVHWGLIFISPVYLVLLDGPLGGVGAVLFALGNLPFVIIQRYNRPRLVQLMQRQREYNERQKKRGSVPGAPEEKEVHRHEALRP